jgi:PAS domain S-box-containing protein
VGNDGRVVSRVSASRRVVAAAVVVGIAGVLFGVLYRRFGTGPWQPTVGVVAPPGRAALLAGVGVWLLWGDPDDGDALRVAMATAVGTAAFGAFALGVALDLLPPATGEARATLVALNFASAGGAVGVLVGLFAARQASTIRQLRRRESDLRRSRDEYRQLFDGVGDAVLVHDSDGVILAANAAATERFGVDEAAFVGRRVTDIETRSATDGGGSERAARRSAAGGVVYETEHAVGGETVPVEVSARRIRYRDTPAMLAVARDISERLESERELQRTRDQLQALNRVVRHDIRNDIQVILTLAEILEDSVDDEGREHLRTIIDSSEYIVEFTKSAGDIARTVSEVSEPPLRAVSLPETLRAEVDRRSKTFGHADIEIEGEVPDVEVAATDLLSSVFRNLLNNAVRHHDGAEPTVRVSADADGDGVVVRVADDGPGVPDGRKAEIFGKGEKGLESAGTGLGLYLVQSLVDRYGGEVWVEDNDPRGAVFCVELRVA